MQKEIDQIFGEKPGNFEGLRGTGEELLPIQHSTKYEQRREATVAFKWIYWG